MGWSLGYDQHWHRDVGYSVPAICDHPGCGAAIDRGIAHVCGGQPYGGEKGCGLYFCGKHLWFAPQQCDRCTEGKEPFEPTPDTPEWIHHKATDPSWSEWRAAQAPDMEAKEL
jgi:hypothetical protein